MTAAVLASTVVVREKRRQNRRQKENSQKRRKNKKGLAADAGVAVARSIISDSPEKLGDGGYCVCVRLTGTATA